MRHLKAKNIPPTAAEESPDYLRGYRDGIRDRRSVVRPASADGLLGALLAIALLAGVSYFGYNYATTGRILPAGVELEPVQLQPAR